MVIIYIKIYCSNEIVPKSKIFDFKNFLTHIEFRKEPKRCNKTNVAGSSPDRTNLVYIYDKILCIIRNKKTFFAQKT